jgi:hypothetical protein
MVRSANALVAVLGMATVIYIIIAEAVTFGGRGLAKNQDIVPLYFIGLVAVSIIDGSITVFTQTRWRPKAGKAQYDPSTRVYLIVSMGAILSEAHTVFGLLLTLLSGSILFVIGFSLVSWVSLLWVRARFKRNLAKI